MLLLCYKQRIGLFELINNVYVSSVWQIFIRLLRSLSIIYYSSILYFLSLFFIIFLVADNERGVVFCDKLTDFGDFWVLLSGVILLIFKYCRFKIKNKLN